MESVPNFPLLTPRETQKWASKFKILRGDNPVGAQGHEIGREPNPGDFYDTASFQAAMREFLARKSARAAERGSEVHELVEHGRLKLKCRKSKPSKKSGQTYDNWAIISCNKQLVQVSESTHGANAERVAKELLEMAQAGRSQKCLQLHKLRAGTASEIAALQGRLGDIDAMGVSSSSSSSASSGPARLGSPPPPRG